MVVRLNRNARGILLVVIVLFAVTTCASGKTEDETWGARLARADSLYREQNLAAAIAMCEQALSAAERSVGEQDTTVARIALRLARFEVDHGSLDLAERHARRSLVIRESVLGPDHIDVAASLNQLASTHYRQGQIQAADSLYRRSLVISEMELGPDNLLAAASRNGLGLNCRFRGEYEQAVDYCRQALAIREALLGPEHEIVAGSLTSVGATIWYLGQLEECVALYERALAIMEGVYGDDHLKITHNLRAVANIYRWRGRYAEARSLCERCLAIQRRYLEADNLAIGQSLSELAAIYFYLERHAEALPLIREALEIFEAHYGPEHPQVLQSLSILAMHLHSLHRWEEAEEIYLRVLDIKRTLYGTEHHEYARTLDTLGVLMLNSNRLEEAEAYMTEALQVNERIFSTDHPFVAGILGNLANVYMRQDRLAEAEAILKRCVEIYAREYGEFDPNFAIHLKNLANVYRAQDRLEEADRLYRQSLAVRERIYGEDHPKVAWCCRDWSRCRRLQDNDEAALAMSKRAFDIQVDAYGLNVRALSERDALRYAANLRYDSNNYLTCYLAAAEPQDPRVAEAAEVVLAVKGGVSDLTIQRRRSQIEGGDPEIVALAAALDVMRTDLANAYFRNAHVDTTGAYRARLDSLRRRVTEMESDLAGRSAEFSATLRFRRPTLRGVVAALPPDAMLIEYLRFELEQPDATSTMPRYLAVILDRSGPPRLVDLGAAARIDSLVADYRRHMDTVSHMDHLPLRQDLVAYRGVARALDEAIIAPCMDGLDDRSRVFVSPDGSLNLVAFAGLVDETGRYRVEDKVIHYLTSARDLLRSQRSEVQGSGLLVVGDPDFDGAPQTVVAADEDSETALRLLDWLQGEDSDRILLDVAALPFTRVEAELVLEIWRRQSAEPATILLGAEASEPAFKDRAPGRRAVHVATHGFFAGNDHQADRLTAVGTGESVEYFGEDPLLLSGLLLAGANRLGGPEGSGAADDGILTAYEILNLDLTGVDLVVLSACETGLGRIENGEGIHGLRRAFLVAGARSVVTALWPLGDEVTAMMVGPIYGNHQGGLAGRIRRSQLDQIARLRDAGLPDHPFSWAGFVAVGDWE